MTALFSALCINIAFKLESRDPQTQVLCIAIGFISGWP